MTEPLARGRSDRAGCDSNEADSAAPHRPLGRGPRSPECDPRLPWPSCCADSIEHDRPREPGMVLGTRCNVCDRPLTVAGCPLCVTCCEREP